MTKLRLLVVFHACSNRLIDHKHVFVEPRSLDHGSSSSDSVDVPEHDEGQFELEVPIEALVVSKIDVCEGLVPLKRLSQVNMRIGQKLLGD